MGSKIEWTDETWNPLAGCDPVSPGCANCYAAPLSFRLQAMGQEKYFGVTSNHTGVVKWTGKINLGGADDIDQPLKWKRSRMIFVNSMSDLFHEAVPDLFIDHVFATMWNAQWHTFQVLTKRIERAHAYLSDPTRPGRMAAAAYLSMNRRSPERAQIMRAADFLPETKRPIRNLLIGPSIENQKIAAERMPHAAAIAAAGWRVMISAEPLLEPNVCLGLLRLPANQRPSWVVVGGESGPHARESYLSGIRGIVRECRAATVPVFVKQLGRHIVVPNDRLSEWPREGDALLIPEPSREAPVHQGDLITVRTIDKKGGKPEEWPEDCRIREAPREAV